MDVLAIAALARELGCEVTPAEALERLRSLPDGDEVLVVETDARGVVAKKRPRGCR